MSPYLIPAGNPVVSNRTKLLMAATLAALIAVVCVAAPLMSLSLRAERLGDQPNPGAPNPRLLGPSRSSCREAPVPPSWSAEYAEIEEEESDEEDEEQAPVPLFLLCGHLVC